MISYTIIMIICIFVSITIVITQAFATIEFPPPHSSTTSSRLVPD